jgi:hypothetical protein
MLAVTFICALAASAQTPRLSTVNIAADSDKAHISAQGDVSEMRVEVYAPGGELTFDSGAVTGQTVEWKMRDEKGARLAEGVYLATISMKESSGQTRKRIEQITVRQEPQREQSPGQSPDAVEATITGTGTAGKISKFTGASTIGDSVIAESANKIGISTSGAPTAKLQINAGQPAVSANNGTAATTLLQTSGGKGGDTSAAGKTGGKGASISLLAGDGGDGVSGATNGSGGSITLQPGSAGTGGFGGSEGNVLIATMAGQVGVGTNKIGQVPGSAYNTKMHVKSDHFVALLGEQTNNGIGVFGLSPDGEGVHGHSDSGYGVYGNSSSGYAGYFSGKAKVTKSLEIGGNLSFGSMTRQMINLYNTTYGIGVQSLTLYFRSNSGYAWYKGGTHSDSQNNAGGGTLLMRLDGAGNLFTAGGVNTVSDRNMKANFSAVNPRLILDRLAAIPIQTWNYKTESTEVRHIGPMAQDFRSAFNLGTDDKHIATVDADGVALAAIQGLYQQNQELKSEVQQLRAQVTQQQAQLNQVKRTIQRKRRARR